MSGWSSAPFPAERVLKAYLGLALIAIAALRPERAVPMAVCYLTALGLLIALSKFGPQRSAFLRGLRIVFPLLLFSPLYTGTGLLSAAQSRWAFSAWLERWETALFHGQPSMCLAQLVPCLWVSEALHAAYVSYYLLVAALPLSLVLRRREREAARAVGVLVLGFALCALCYIWLPVASPFFIYPPIGPPLSGGFFYGLAHGISNRGGVLGGAFPSSHAALTVINLLLAFKLERRLFWWTLLPSILLLIATVYCRYHYALDTIAGTALAITIVAVVLRWERRAQR